MRIQFAVVCDSCNQQLETADGETYIHLNNADCDAGDATLPPVTVEQVASLFAVKAVKKAATKTAGKKK